MKAFLAAFLSFVMLFTLSAPSFAGGELVDRVVVEEGGPHGTTKIVETYKGNYFKIETYKRVDWSGYRDYVVKRFSASGPFYSGGAGEVRETGSLVNRFFNDAKMLVQGVNDILEATGGGIFGEGMKNLNSAEDRYRFWKEKGIYEKYSPREIVLLNKIAFPVAVILQSLKAAGGLSLASYALAAAVGASFWPVLAVGAGAYIAFTAYKAWQVKKKGADIAAGLAEVPSDMPPGWDVRSPGRYGQLVIGSGLIASGSAAWGAVSLIEGAFGAVTAPAGYYLAGEASFDTTRLANAWGIPLPVQREDLTLEPDFSGGPESHIDVDEGTIRLEYRLTE